MKVLWMVNIYIKKYYLGMIKFGNEYNGKIQSIDCIMMIASEM